MEPEPPGDAVAHELQQSCYGRLGILGIDKVEVAMADGRAQVGQLALVDAVRHGDNAALGRLPKHSGQTHHGHHF